MKMQQQLETMTSILADEMRTLRWESDPEEPNDEENTSYSGEANFSKRKAPVAAQQGKAVSSQPAGNLTINSPVSSKIGN